ncbi:kiSS-1 receptor-like [Saccostrea echinata]|uniref:kiSS-1 receptor-like n=1 Tax=Saccostrea echinata TaxID=191078 RepID=UPI002A82F8C1|nr:kiSS-1 receptor-like [Saccostrea echinata]
MNNSTMNGTKASLVDSNEYNVALIIIWTALVVVGDVGNTLTIYIICRFTVKSATIIYILSLAIADLTFLTVVVPSALVGITINLPTLLIDLHPLVGFLQNTAAHVTCWTLMAMTIDRYLAIVYPVKSLNWRTTKTSVLVFTGVWIVSVVLSIPYAVLHESVLSNELGVGVSLTSFGIPLLVIIACYAKILVVLHKRDKEMLQKVEERKRMKKTRRVIKMVAVLILLFACSWGPIQVLFMWRNLDPSFPHSMELFYFEIFAHTLSYANSCINPFVYAFMNKRIRTALAARFRTKCIYME